MMKRFSIVLVALCSAQAHSEAWNLSRIVEKVLSYQPSLKLEKEKLNQIDAQKWQVIASIMPAVNGSLQYQQKKDATLQPDFALFQGDPYNNYDVSLGVTQPVYRGGALSAAKKASDKDQEIQKTSIEKSERDLIVQAVEDFYKVILAQRNLETVERLHDIQTRLLKTAQERFRIGNETQLTVLQIKTQLLLLDPQIRQAKNDLSLAGQELASLAGIENLSELALKGQLGPWNFPMQRNADAQERPEWKSLQLSVDRLKDERAVVLSKHWPQVDAFANIQRAGFTRSDLGDPNATSWNFGVTIKVPIFSGLQSVYERQELNSRAEQLALQSQKLRDDLNLERVTAFQNFDNARNLEEGSHNALSQAQEAVKVAERFYRTGTIDYLQISDTQKSLADAERSYAQSQFQVLDAFTKCYVAYGWSVSDLPKVVESAVQAAK